MHLAPLMTKPNLWVGPGVDGSKFVAKDTTNLYYGSAYPPPLQLGD